MTAPATAQQTLTQQAEGVAQLAEQLSEYAHRLALDTAQYTFEPGATNGSFLMTGLTVFVLACFVGYYVVWRVTPALHSPLMAITNAISSVIIVGALIAAGPAAAEGVTFSKFMGFLAIILASINIFGGFIGNAPHALHVQEKSIKSCLRFQPSLPDFFHLLYHGASRLVFPVTSRQGLNYGIIGMIIAILTTLATPIVQSYFLIVLSRCRSSTCLRQCWKAKFGICPMEPRYRWTAWRSSQGRRTQTPGGMVTHVPPVRTGSRRCMARPMSWKKGSQPTFTSADVASP